MRAPPLFRPFRLALGLFGLAGLLIPGAAQAARGELFSPPALAFERLDAENLLPQSSVYDLAERQDGYLWLVTLDGLVRFDGLGTKVFDRTGEPGMGTTRLSALWDDPESGSLWIGAEDGRVLLRRGGGFETFAATQPALGPVTSLRRGRDGLLFIFYHHGAERARIGGDGRLERVGEALSGESFYTCGDALYGEDGLLWQAGEDAFFSLPLPPEVAGTKVRETCQNAAGGGVWLRSPSGGLWKVSGRRLEADRRGGLLPPDALPFAEDAAGNLWVKLPEAPRLGRLDKEGRFLRYGEAAGVDPKGEVIRGYFDREGGFWIGSTTALYRYLGEAIGGLRLRHPGGEIEVKSHFEAADGTAFIATPDRRLWRLAAGGELEELTVLDGRGRLVLRPDLLEGESAQGPIEAPDDDYQAFAEAGGSVFIGTGAGLLRWRNGRLRVFPSSRFVPGAPGLSGGINDILIAGEELWLATTEAVIRTDGEKVLQVWGPPEGVSGALTLLHGRDGTWWAGTHAGVLRLAGESFAAVPGLGPELGQARELYEDELGRLWVGTYNQGLFRRLPDGRVEHAGPPQGFPESGVFTLRFDRRGFLWSTSNRGLLRTRALDVDRLLATGKGKVPAVLYGRSAGLPSSECNGGFGAAGYDCQGGGWCFQTLAGIAVARLDETRVVSRPPVAAIEEALVDGVPRPVAGGRLALGPADRNLLVRFTGIAFEGAPQLQFRYRLAGYDPGWMDTAGRREALFGDLPPGFYGLEVVAESREGREGEPARLSVEVAPAFWESGAFRLLVLALAVGLLWGGVRFRLRLSARRHARRELALKADAEELEKRVRQRTAELDAEVAERRRAEEQARQASAAKSAFLAQMSHELRTPMNAIIGLSEMLARTPLSPQQNEWVSTVCSSGEALMSIIDDILDFSRIEAGRLEVEAREFAPAETVAEAVRIVATLAQGKGLAIGWSQGPGVPRRAVGDAPRLRQVLLNLLGNAIKFTREGGVEVGLAAKPLDKGWLLEIAVRDTGIGIAPEAQARIFEPFTQADASMSRRFGGSGLGLAICQRIVAALGGRLLVESKPGEGSTFTIECPVGRAAGDEDLSGLRVLVGEADPMGRLVSRSLLQALGITPEIAASGEELAAKLAAQEFDAVLADQNLLGSLETPAERRPYRIALVAADSEEEAAGWDDFITKPIREQDLRSALERAAARHCSGSRWV
jgi:signal transduction histidine kinase/CheY-like chemotaxis protein